MRQGRIRIIFVSLFMLLISAVNLQAQGVLNGLILQKDTDAKLGNVSVYNKATSLKTLTDNAGRFKIIVSVGDTLIITCNGYLEQAFRVTNFNTTMVYMQLPNYLSEVEIKGKLSKQSTIEKAAADYSKEKGIFYKGKPPIALLSPFGGSPVTFFYELFSKDAKRVRRLQKLSVREADYNEVEARFNNKTIKNVISIKDGEIDEFKSIYWPTTEQIRTWTDYELYSYIKKCYSEFGLRGTSKALH